IITTSFSHPKQHHSGGKNGFRFSCMFRFMLTGHGEDSNESCSPGFQWCDFCEVLEAPVQSRTNCYSDSLRHENFRSVCSRKGI
ncbi:unnamed protein product, partial [Nesidiocoris tenuis]